MRKLLARMAAEWDRKLSAAMWTIFLYQYIHWLSRQEYNGLYWLDPSTWSAETTLLMIGIMELLLHGRKRLRVALEFLVVLGAHLIYMDFDPVWVPLSSWEALEAVIRMNVSQLFPYALFGLVTALVFHIVSGWAVTKGKILFVVIASVIDFAIVDSFSKEFYFWDQVGWLIFSGLALLIIRHFAEFKVKHPASWQWLKEYPGKVAAPVVLLLIAIFLAAVFAPNSRPFLTDPYTAWKTMRGETVAGIGKGYGRVTPKSQAFSAGSGYSRNDEVIGGGFNYDYSEVMTVSTSHRSYWRGEVRSFYTGKGWKQSPSEQNAAPVPVIFGQPLSGGDGAVDTSKLKTVEVTQTVTMANEEHYPVLFAAHAPAEVNAIGEGEAGFAFAGWRPEQQELRFDAEKAGGYPRSYQITSKMPVIDEEGLRQASTELPAHLAEQYLQLPDTVPQRVKDLAVQITQGADSDYDRMKLLETYLKTEYAYTNTPDVSKGNGDDFVDDFLFEIREGYCDYYSTAMVVMARSLGVPARWVKGYATGVSELEQYMLDFQELYMGADPSGAGTYIVRNADAHSWVEVYFEGYGWIPFEPTASFSYPLVTDQELDPVSLPQTPGSETDGESGTPAAGRPPVWQQIALPAILAVVLAVLAVWKRTPLLRLLRRLNPGRRGMDTDEARDEIIRDVERFLKYARRKGFARQEHETLRETVARWSERAKWLKPNLEQLLSLFEKAKYSASPVAMEDVRKTRQLVERLRADMK